MTSSVTKRLPRGAIPSPRWALAAAMPHIPDPRLEVPSSYLAWPIELSYWGYGVPQSQWTPAAS